MKPPSSNVAYMAGLVSSGVKSAVSVGRDAWKDESVTSFLTHSAQVSWKPAAIGACIGVFASIWKGERSFSSTVRDGVVGSGLGLAGGMIWHSRGVTHAVIHGVLERVNVARDERWLELNPIDFG